MARWQRDVKARRRLALLLVAAEVVALTACFFWIFSAYLYQVFVRLGYVLRGGLETGYYVACGVASAAVLAGAVLVGRKFLAGVLWARRAFIIANVVLLVLGLVWFIRHEFMSAARSDTTAALAGLLLPMVTLFPLLWPLITFRPVHDDRQGDAASDAGP